MALAGHRLLQWDHSFSFPESEKGLESGENICEKKKKKVECHIFNSFEKNGLNLLPFFFNLGGLKSSLPGMVENSSYDLDDFHSIRQG